MVPVHALVVLAAVQAFVDFPEDSFEDLDQVGVALVPVGFHYIYYPTHLSGLLLFRQLLGCAYVPLQDLLAQHWELLQAYVRLDQFDDFVQYSPKLFETVFRLGLELLRKLLALFLFC